MNLERIYESWCITMNSLLWPSICPNKYQHLPSMHVTTLAVSYIFDSKTLRCIVTLKQKYLHSVGSLRIIFYVVKMPYKVSAPPLHAHKDHNHVKQITLIVDSVVLNSKLVFSHPKESDGMLMNPCVFV